MPDHDLIQLFSKPEDLPRLDVYIRGLSLKPSHRLMDQYPRMGKSKSFPLLACCEQQSRNAGWLPHAYRGHLGPNILHRIVNRKSRRDNSSWRIDVEMNILGRIFRFQKKHLGNDQVGDIIVDRRPNKNDSFLQKTGIDIISPLAPSIFLNYNRYQCHRFFLK